MDQVRDENLDLRTRLDQLKQYSRKTNLVIHSIPLQEDEKISEIIQKLASALKLPHNKLDIAASHKTSW